LELNTRSSEGRHLRSFFDRITQFTL
jgi:hypothetical protein